MHAPLTTISRSTSCTYVSCSHVVSTKRTILSPFTKEYRVLATYSGIRPFLDGSSCGIIPHSSKSEIFLQYNSDYDKVCDFENYNAGMILKIIIMGFPSFLTLLSYQFISKTNLYIHCFTNLQIPYY